jgi:hypothetical protein
MARRRASQAPTQQPSPPQPANLHGTAAGYLQDPTALNLAAHQYRPGMLLPHEPGAQHRAMEVDRKQGPAPQLGYGMQRLDTAVHRYRDPDDTANDPSLMSGFNAANRQYEDAHMQSHAPPQPDPNANHSRGTQNEQNLKQIIANRQARAAQNATSGGQGGGGNDDGTN